MTFTVARVPAATTYPLRQQVLRPHQRPEDLRLPGDADPQTGTFAALGPGHEVWGTACVLPEACPWCPDRADSWRLRGMATAEGARGKGIGTEVLAAVLAHVAGKGGGLIWCNARVPALSFYRRAGFDVHGPEWVDPVIGPHVAMWREVAEPPQPNPSGR